MVEDDVQLIVVDAASPEAQWAMAQYFTELDARFPEGFVATGALDEAATAYNPPAGLFVLATAGAKTIGCGGLQLIDDDIVELKRMWVSPACRGQGLATRLLQRLEDETHRLGRSTVVLDTHTSLTEAIALYERRGYQATDPYNDNLYAQRWFRKSLGA
jgi:GNAT superfamily N-acetyltransferase